MSGFILSNNPVQWTLRVKPKRGYTQAILGLRMIKITLWDLAEVKYPYLLKHARVEVLGRNYKKEETRLILCTFASGVLL
jgi:hypothetical protein